ncbi:MAG: pilus assembly protein [Bradyrhizobium sp.]
MNANGSAARFAAARKLISNFCAGNQGNIAILFGIAAIPIICFVGAAIDYTRANKARSSMQAALDSTALMLAKDLSSNTITASDINTKAQAYFKALYNNIEARAVNVSATYTPPTSSGSNIVVNGAGNVDTTFMKIVGFPKIDFNASSTSVWGNVKMRVAIALDVTGSMDDDGKMTAMKPAAKALIDQIGALAKSPGDVYVSIIPFAKDVNVGASNYNQTWINWTEWDANNQNCTVILIIKTCTGPKAHSTWNGCITDRDQDYDTKNTTPTADKSTQFYAEQYTDCPAQLLPLTTDFAAAKSKVDSLASKGGTNQPIGIAWGWQSLTQGVPLNAPAEDSNATTNKVLIVMSDGLNTMDRWPAYGNGQVQYLGQIDARQKIQCDNIKAAGVIVYTMQINTGGDPTSTVLKNCASSADKFVMVTSSTQIMTAFTSIGSSLSKLRVAR